MALEAITMEGPEARVSAQVARLIATCSRDWERFFADHDTAEARGPLRYDGMESAIADIGLFFAYPWPEERELMRQLFEAVARAGAMLVVYHTDTVIRVFRKVESQVELEDSRAQVHRRGASPRHHAMAESQV